MIFTRILLFLLCGGFIIFGLSGCKQVDSRGSAGEKTGSVQLQLCWSDDDPDDSQQNSTTDSAADAPQNNHSDIPDEVKTIRGVINGPDMTPLQRDFPVALRKGRIDNIPAGNHRTLRILGLNTGNNVVYSNQDPIVLDIRGGEPTHAGAVQMIPATDKRITRFAFLAADNVILSNDIEGIINHEDGTIILPVPHEVSLSALVARFETTGSAVRMGHVIQQSGQSPNDYRLPVTLTVLDDTIDFRHYTITTRSVGWVQSAYIKAMNSDTDDRFGYNIALHGDTLAVGALAEDSSKKAVSSTITASFDNGYKDSGAVYIYKWNGTAWQLEGYLKAPNAWNEERFGSAIALYGDRVAIGAFEEGCASTTIINGTESCFNSDSLSSGAVYVYRRIGTTWTQEAFFKAGNNNSGDWFGWSVALTDDTLAVGAQNEDSCQKVITNGTSSSPDNSCRDAGAVYIYRRTADTHWEQEAYLKAANASADDQFGFSLSLSGDTLAVGARLEDGAQQSITNGETAAADDSAQDAGAVYVYKRDGTTWKQEAYLKASNAEAGDKFGFSVTLDGDTLAVGAPVESSATCTILNGPAAATDNDAPKAGAVYVYQRNGSAWQQDAYLKASNGEAYDKLGFKVSLSGDRLAVGAKEEDSSSHTVRNNGHTANDNDAIEAGAVYVYRRVGATWQQEAYLKASNSNPGEHYGEFLSFSGQRIAVGSYLEDSSLRGVRSDTQFTENNSLPDSGAAYIYTFSE